MAILPQVENQSIPNPSEDEKHLMTLEALQDVSEGRVASNKDVASWVKSLGTDKPLPRPLS